METALVWPGQISGEPVRGSDLVPTAVAVRNAEQGKLLNDWCVKKKKTSITDVLSHGPSYESKHFQQSLAR